MLQPLPHSHSYPCCGYTIMLVSTQECTPNFNLLQTSDAAPWSVHCVSRRPFSFTCTGLIFQPCVQSSAILFIFVATHDEIKCSKAFAFDAHVRISLKLFRRRIVTL